MSAVQKFASFVVYVAVDFWWHWHEIIMGALAMCSVLGLCLLCWLAVYVRACWRDFRAQQEAAERDMGYQLWREMACGSWETK